MAKIRILALTKELAGNEGGEKDDLGIKLSVHMSSAFVLFPYDSLCSFTLL